MININTNLSSLIAQRSFNQSSISLDRTIERLTTGYKLNHAKDNAANYSISTKMSTKLNSYFIAEDNAMAGMDLLNTATGNIKLITNNVRRLHELSIQASNGIYDEKSLKAINTEANACVDEIEKLYGTTEYNGIKFGGNEENTKFMNDINRRDTSKMSTLDSVKIDEALNSGTYSITTAEELAKLATMTNNGLIGSDTEFVLGADIDLSSYSDWTPIGNSTTKFTGDFDGNGYVVSNLKIKTSDGRLGLFGRISGSEIKNLGVESLSIIMNGVSDDKHVGGLVGYIGASKITNCYTTGSIDAKSGGKIVGGLVGQVFSDCIIDSCYSECKVSNVNSNGGGLVGALETRSVLKNSFSTGAVTGSSSGGLVGVVLTDSSVENCYSTGNITGGQTGGLIGSLHTRSNVSNCWSSSLAKSSANSSAGLVYQASDAVIRDSYLFSENDKYKGIIVGAYRSGGSGNIKIENCYYSDYYNSLSIPISGANNTTANNNNSYSGPTPYTYNKNAKAYTYCADINLQIGIYSDNSSSIDINAGYVLKGFTELRGIGLVSGDYINRCNILLEELNKKESEFGATYNRLESVLEEISIKQNNLISSHSTLKDSNIAKESSEYIRYQILQQASSTLLSTANQTPSIALQLI